METRPGRHSNIPKENKERQVNKGSSVKAPSKPSQCGGSDATAGRRAGDEKCTSAVFLAPPPAPLLTDGGGEEVVWFFFTLT